VGGGEDGVRQAPGGTLSSRTEPMARCTSAGCTTSRTDREASSESGTGRPACDHPELVLQAQAILKLAQLHGVQSTYKGQAVTLVPHHVQKMNPADAWSKEPQKMTVDGWAMVYDETPTARSLQGPSVNGSPPKTKSKVVMQSGGSSSSKSHPDQATLQGSLKTATMTPIPEENK